MLLLVLFILAIPIVQSKMEMTLNEFLSSIIKQKNNINYCVNYVYKNSSINDIVENSLLNVNYPVNVMTKDVFLKNNKQKLCSIYVLFCDNVSGLNEYFNNETIEFYVFKTRSKIYIFTEDNYTLNISKKFIWSMVNDVVIIDGLVPSRFNKDITLDDDITLDGYFDEIDLNVTVTSLIMDQTLARWINGFGYFLKAGGLNLEKWQPIFNETFTGSAFHCPPFVYCRGVKPYDGVDYRIFTEITKSWNSKAFCKDANTDDNYSKIVENTKSGVSDVSFCSLWITTVNQEPLELTNPYAQVCASFLVPKPQLLPKFAFVFQPFQLQLWFLYIFILLITSILFYITDIFYIKMNNERFFGNFFHALLETLRILTLGASKRSPNKKQNIFRFILIFWWICALLLTTAYSAGITSALTTPRYTKSINTLQDMADHNIKWGNTNGGMKMLYKISPDNIIRQIANNFLIERNDEEKLKRIRNNNYGTFVKILAEKYVTDTEMLDDYAKVNLKTLTQCIGEYPLIFVLKNNSPFINIFNQGIQSLLENGLINYWYRRIRYKYGLRYLENFYSDKKKKENIPLSFERLLGLLYLLLLGNLIATAIFIVEYCIYYYYKK